MIDIRIKIADEQDLYNPFSTNDELSDDVKSYIAAQLEKITHPDAIRFTIVAPEPLDMERLDRARMRWNADLQEGVHQTREEEEPHPYILSTGEEVICNEL